MLRAALRCLWTTSIVVALCLAPGAPASAQDAARSGALFDALARMDQELFDAAFVTCDQAKFRTLFTDDAEFYHDRTGPAFGDEARTMKSCPREQGVTRELIAGSLEVYPISDWGAVQIGRHRFTKRGEPGAEVAKFVHLWKRDGDAWRLARVLSFDHRPETPQEP